jgi:acyl carrier protein
MKLKELLVESFSLKDEEYNDEQSLMRLKEFDSMNHMLFITKLEDEFNIELTGDQIAEMSTIKHIKEALLSKGIDNF